MHLLRDAVSWESGSFTRRHAVRFTTGAGVVCSSSSLLTCFLVRVHRNLCLSSVDGRRACLWFGAVVITVTWTTPCTRPGVFLRQGVYLGEISRSWHCGLTPNRVPA